MDDSKLLSRPAGEPDSPTLDQPQLSENIRTSIDFRHHPLGRKRREPLAALLDGLAFAVALFKQPEIVLDVFVVWILATGGGKRCVRTLVVAAQHV